MTQDEALTILKTGANVFLTGEPGSGKSYTVNRFVAYLRECGIEPAITASTGIAATHIRGMTIHSWSGIGIKNFLSEYDLDKITANERIAKRIMHTKVLILDEVSMLSATTFEMVDAVCRAVRRSHKPFGGLQVVLVGDFFQLPPIVRRDSARAAAAEQGFDFDEGAAPVAPFCYRSAVWTRLNPLVCYLEEQHRQEDGEFLELLSAIRSGEVASAHRASIKKRTIADTASVPASCVRLFPHNADVDTINTAELAKTPGAAKRYTMQSSGSPAMVEALKRGCLSPEVLELKIGAAVMCTKNNPTAGYVNGTLGEVIGFDPAHSHPIIKTRSGSRLVVEPAEWPMEEDGRVLAKLTQVPLRLAWAITIHKSQGMSLDAAVMDLSQTFEYGQGYVALSRIRTLAGLYLLGVNERALSVHPDAARKDIEFRDQSALARETFDALPAAEVGLLQSNFLAACGGAAR